MSAVTCAIRRGETLLFEGACSTAKLGRKIDAAEVRGILERLDVTGVVAGTGFVKSVLTLPLLRRLVEFYDIPVDGGVAAAFPR